MRCRGCGREISSASTFCQYCGYSIHRQAEQVPQQVKNREGLSVIKIVLIVIVVLVVATVALSALLYYMVLGFGSYSAETPYLILSETRVTAGFKFTFSPPTSETHWSDITIALAEGGHQTVWLLHTYDLDDGWSTTAVCGARTMGALIVHCNVTDIAGNGYINQGDHFVLTTGGELTFSATATYIVTITYMPTSGTMCSHDFSG